MTTYVKAVDNETKVLAEAMCEHHQRLESIGVTVAMLLVFAEIDKHGELKGSALRLYQPPLLRVLKIRAHGLSDAEILIDGDLWEQRSSSERLALIDHELTHLDPVYKDNALQLDDLGRPRLKMRPHDYDFGWFAKVVERHRRASIESQQARRFMNESGQLFLEFSE